MKRKFLLAATSTALVVSMSFTAFAAPVVKIDGVNKEFTNEAVIEDGSTLVPMRELFEALGATVEWNGEEQSITAAKADGKSVYLVIGSNKMTVEGDMVIELAVPAKLIGNSTYVPLRAVSEAFGADVSWDGETSTVSINTNGGEASAPAEDLAPASPVVDSYKIEMKSIEEIVKTDSGKIALELSMQYPAIDSSSEYALKFNEEAEAFARKLFDDAKAKYSADAIDIIESGKSSAFYICSLTSEVKYNKSGYLSVYYAYSENTGGANANVTYSSVNADIKNGSELTIADVTGMSGDEAAAAIKKAFEDDIDQNSSNYLSNAKDNLDSVFNPDSFYITDSGIVAFVQLYDIAPRSSGVPSVTIPSAIPIVTNGEDKLPEDGAAITGEVGIEIKELNEEVKNTNGKVIMTVRVQYPEISYDSSFVEELNADFAETAKGLVEFIINEYSEDAAEYSRQGGSAAYSYDFKVETKYNQDGVISIYYASSAYTAGAHPTTTYESQTIDLNKNQAAVSLASILGKSEGIVLADIRAEFVKKINASPTDYYEDALEKLDEAIKTKNFYISNDGIVVYIQQYDIAPYAAGTPSITLKLPQQQN